MHYFLYVHIFSVFELKHFLCAHIGCRRVQNRAPGDFSVCVYLYEKSLDIRTPLLFLTPLKFDKFNIMSEDREIINRHQ